MNSRVWTIALHEYITNVRRKEFLLITLGLPLLMLVITGISALGASSVIGQIIRGREEKVGIVDQSGELALPPAGTRWREATIFPYSDPREGQEAVRAGRIAGLIVVGPHYLEKGSVDVYKPGGGLIGKGDLIPVGAILTRALLVKSAADPKVVERIVNPAGPGSATFQWSSKRGQFERATGAGEAARFLVPYAFTMILFTSIFIAASYLLRGIADEKENRVIEVILSSVSPEELLKGKLFGLAAVGLTQVGIWMSIGVVPAALAFSRVVHLSAATIAGVLLFFALGFGLFATLMAGIGSLGTSYRETQQISGGVSMLAIFPLLLMTVILEYPNGALARALSYIPFTAPTTMVMRISSTDVPAVDYAAATLSVVLGIWLVEKLSARLFRFGLLIYGKRPTLRETIRWLRQSS